MNHQQTPPDMAGNTGADIPVTQSSVEDTAPDRRQPRRRVLKGVKVTFNNEYCVVSGVMKNISKTGALIEVLDGLLVPDEIIIVNELEGYKVAAKIVRRRVNQVGVQFIGEKEIIGQKRTQVVNMVNDSLPRVMTRDHTNSETASDSNGASFGRRGTPVQE